MTCIVGTPRRVTEALVGGGGAGLTPDANPRFLAWSAHRRIQEYHEIGADGIGGLVPLTAQELTKAHFLIAAQVSASTQRPLRARLSLTHVRRKSSRAATACADGCHITKYTASAIQRVVCSGHRAMGER